jgi:hypothetical protein
MSVTEASAKAFAEKLLNLRGDLPADQQEALDRMVKSFAAQALKASNQPDAAAGGELERLNNALTQLSVQESADGESTWITVTTVTTATATSRWLCDG